MSLAIDITKIKNADDVREMLNILENSNDTSSGSEINNSDSDSDTDSSDTDSYSDMTVFEIDNKHFELYFYVKSTLICKLITGQLYTFHYKTEGSFKLITNDGKSDDLIMATRFLNERLKKIEEKNKSDDSTTEEFLKTTNTCNIC